MAAGPTAKTPLPAPKNAPAKGLRGDLPLLKSFPRLREPLPYQNAPIAAIAKKERVLIHLDKRLGKCITAIRWALFQQANKILVVAPKSALPGWMNEIEDDGFPAILYGSQTAEELDEIVYAATGATNPVPSFVLVNPQKLISYAGVKVDCDVCGGSGGSTFEGEEPVICGVCEGKGRVRRGYTLANRIVDLSWDAIIWDEISNLRNPKSQVSQFACSQFSSIPKRAGLSGELVIEGEEDVFMPMKFLFGAFMGKHNFYSWRHTNFMKLAYTWTPKPGKMHEIKTVMHSRGVFLTRKEAGVELQAPSFEPRYCDLPPKVMKVYKHVERLFELPSIGAFPGKEFKQSIVGRSYMVQLSSGYPKNPFDGGLLEEMSSDHKLALVEELVRGDYAKQKLVWLFRHNLELAACFNFLQKLGRRPSFITGAISDPNERRKIGNAFNRGNDTDILLQFKVAQFGIDLSAADTIVRFSLSDSYEDISQSADRTAHPLKPRQRHFIDLIARDTYDEDIYGAISPKKMRADYFRTRLRSNFYKRTGNQLPM